jgi:soluble lytic murein transglycosylase-like protein
MRDSVARARAEARDARSDLAETQAQLERVRAIQSYSETYQIPADLAASIHDQARAEDLDADLAFRLVQVESGFRQRAVSDVGAVGYTQLLPSTAEWLEPGISKESLFDRDTNLRLGFRYLRTLLDAYDGDSRLALLAYNRGPGVVRSIVAAGGDPANGFARQVLGTAE